MSRYFRSVPEKYLEELHQNLIFLGFEIVFPREPNSIFKLKFLINFLVLTEQVIGIMIQYIPSVVPSQKKHLIIVLVLAKCWFWDDASDGCHGKENKS